MGDKWQKAKVSKFVVGENGLEIKGEYCPEPQCGPAFPCRSRQPQVLRSLRLHVKNDDDHASKALHVPSLSTIITFESLE